jgi:hypothetical protein
VIWASLDQQHRGVGALGQTRCQHGTGRAGADHHEVEWIDQDGQR